MARRANPLPFTVGIFGPWGSGKSSFMRMWQDALAFAPEDRSFWFNPWKYDQKTAVWAAFLQSLLARVATDESVRERANRLARALTWLTLRTAAGVAAATATHGAVGRDATDSAIDAAVGSIVDQDRAFYDQLNRFELDFTETVSRWLGDCGRLFVFIDDLDRCTPDAAIEVLESLQPPVLAPNSIASYIHKGRTYLRQPSRKSGECWRPCTTSR